ncbi:MAG: hypothetical protein ACO3ZW_04340 [Opitutales bacterium]|jgi:acyl-CoA reductase-like NAD-dependent aldehyde dehydrogenase
MPDSINSASGRVIAHYPLMSMDAVMATAGKTACAAGQWAGRLTGERAGMVGAVATVLERRLEELALQMSGRTMGDPEQAGTQIGLMARADLRDKLQEVIAHYGRML